MHRSLLAVIAILMLIGGDAIAAPPVAKVNTALSASQFAPGSRGVLAIAIDIPQGLHAQSHTPLDEFLIPFEVKPAKQTDLQFSEPLYPKPTIETYPQLGKVSVYTGHTVVYVPFTVDSAASDGTASVSGVVNYQMCDDQKCFLPSETKFLADVLIRKDGTPVSNLNAKEFAGFDPKLLDGSTSRPTTSPATRATASSPPESSNFSPQSLAGAVLIALLVGVIFNFVPCVLPVLPLKAVGFYEAAQHDRAKTIVFGLVFSAGMVAVFTTLAVLVVLSKSVFGRQIQWGEQFAHPVFVWVMAAVLAGLGLSMLGLFAVRLPMGIYGLNFRHDTLVGNAMWGGLTAILATPCTAPLFPPLLAYAIAQPPLYGFITMVAVGVGMASPYLILSAFPQVASKFPRTGPFAELFKQMMAFLLFGTAAWLAGIRLVADPNQWWLVFAVVVIAALYLVFRTRQIIPTVRATIISAALALLLIAGGLGATRRLTDVPFKWEPYTAESYALARRGDKTVLVEFTAAWCLNCKYIEQTVYHDEQTRDEIQKRNVIALKADLTDHSAPGWKLLNELGGTGIPFTAIFPPAAKDPLTLESIYTSDTLLQMLDQAKR